MTVKHLPHSARHRYRREKRRLFIWLMVTWSIFALAGLLVCLFNIPDEIRAFYYWPKFFKTGYTQNIKNISNGSLVKIQGVAHSDRAFLSYWHKWVIYEKADYYRIRRRGHLNTRTLVHRIVPFWVEIPDAKILVDSRLGLGGTHDIIATTVIGKRNYITDYAIMADRTVVVMGLIDRREGTLVINGGSFLQRIIITNMTEPELRREQQFRVWFYGIALFLVASECMLLGVVYWRYRSVKRLLN